MSARPHLTVATVVERDGRFLLVEEETPDGVRINQPAGHLEAGESIPDGAMRETLEETAYRVRPEALLGVYRWARPASDVVYVRFAFVASVTGHEPDHALDQGILRALWLSAAEVRACHERHRSPLVMRCIDDYLAGIRHPLGVLVHHD